MTQNKLILLLGVVVVCMLGWIGLRVSNPVINYSTTVVENKPANPTHGLFQAGRRPSGLHPDVNVVSSTPSRSLVPHDCVPLPKSPKPEVKICVYPDDKDIYVSKQLKHGLLFEEQFVTKMATILKSDPELQMVDFGANIGVYTMFAAAAGADVLSVDMLPDNIHHIQESLHVSDLADRVTLVNNGLYSDHRELTANFISNNVGATHLNVSRTANFKSFGMPEDNTRTIKVKTICIDDLIPLVKSRKLIMKMDIERTENKALTCAHNFFKQIDVRVILMEWLAKSKKEIQDINAFMTQHGYKPSTDPFKLVPVNTNVETVPGSNVFFIKAA